MDMKEEMMNDAIDDVIGDEEDDEERLVKLGDFFGAILLATHSLSQTCLRRRGGLRISALDSGLSSSGLSPGQGHCIVFLGKTLYSHSASLHPDV